jgi:hypothetical protein
MYPVVEQQRNDITPNTVIGYRGISCPVKREHPLKYVAENLPYKIFRP